MRNASIHVVLFLCVISLILTACGGQSSVSSLNGDSSVETVKTSSFDNPGVAWPMAGNTITNSSYQPLSTAGGLSILDSMYVYGEPENLSQVVVGTDYHTYMANNLGNLICADSYGVDLPWAYDPPNTSVCNIPITPAWYDPDGSFKTDNERIYHVYRDDSNAIYMCSLLPDGSLDWTSSSALGDRLIRCSPTVTPEFIYIVEGQSTPLGGQFLVIHAIERASGTVIASANAALYYDTAVTLAIGGNGYLYMLAANTATCESILFQIEFTGTQFLYLNNTPLLTGTLLCNNAYGYDTQHGPVVYEANSTEYVAFSLADTTAGVSGGVYAYTTSGSLSTPAWTNLTGQQEPVYCSGLSEKDGKLYYSYQDPASTPVPATDTYNSRVVEVNGATGFTSWSTVVFDGRIGSALAISQEWMLYGQAKYQNDCSLLKFDRSNTPGNCITLEGPGIAGAGPVSLANYREGDPGLFFIEYDNGLQYVLHQIEVTVESGTPWPQAGNTADKGSHQSLVISPTTPATVTLATGTGNLSQPVVSNDFHTYISCTNGDMFGYDSANWAMSMFYTPPSISASYIAVTPAWYDPDDDPSTDNARIYHVYQNSSDEILIVSLRPDGSTEWTSSASLGNSMLRSSPTVYGDYIFIMEALDTGLGYQVIQISGIDRITGTVIATNNMTLIYDLSTNIAVDSAGDLYFIAASTSNSVSALFKVDFNGSIFSVLSISPQVPGTLLLGDPNGYDSQHGPVIYESGATEYVAFSLADLPSGVSGGVYAFTTASLAAPVWTAHTGLLRPAYCSGLSAANGYVFYTYQDPSSMPIPLLDIYQSKAAMRDGASGASLWWTRVFEGRIGSALTVSDNLMLYGQASYQTDCSFWFFNTSNVPDTGTVLTAGTFVGKGPVALADCQPNTPGFFYLDYLGGLLQIQY